MTAKRLDITIEQGADYDRPFFLTDDAGEIDDLTGVAFAMQIRTTPDAPNALLTLTSATGGLDVDIESGTVRPVIPGTVTAVLLPGTYVYDLKSRDAAGRTRRRRSGFVSVSPQVTTAGFPDPSPSPSPSPPPSGGQLNFSIANNSAYAALI